MERRTSWEQRAKCLDEDTDLYFPDENRKSDIKMTCTDCPVLNQCRSYAIAHEEVGVWGGTTYRDRKKLGIKLIVFIRGMYYDAGILEYRPGLVADYINSRQASPL